MATFKTQSPSLSFQNKWLAPHSHLQLSLFALDRSRATSSQLPHEGKLWPWFYSLTFLWSYRLVAYHFQSLQSHPIWDSLNFDPIVWCLSWIDFCMCLTLKSSLQPPWCTDFFRQSVSLETDWKGVPGPQQETQCGEYYWCSCSIQEWDSHSASNQAGRV